MGKQRKEAQKNIALFYIPLCVFVITLGIVLGTLLIKKIDWNHFLFFGIISLVISFLLCILLILQKDTIFPNKRAFFQCMVVYVLGIFLAIGSSFLPYYVWIFLPYTVLLLFFSSVEIAVIGSSSMLLFCGFFTEMNPFIFSMNFIIIIFAVLIFCHATKATHFIWATIAALSLHFVLVYSHEILFLQGTVTNDIVFYPILCTIINGICLFFVLKTVDVFVLHKYGSVYTQINDQEFSLLKEMKEKEPSLYYHSIHCAYLSEKVALKVGVASTLVKAGAYYKSLMGMHKEADIEAMKVIYKENKFPMPLIELLLELNETKRKEESKEATIIRIVDRIVTMIELLYLKNKDIKLNVDEIITLIFVDKFKAGEFAKWQFTCTQVMQIEAILKGEKLYYDFLRRE